MFFKFKKEQSQKELCNKENNMTQENMEIEKVQNEEPRQLVTSADDLDQVIERAKTATRVYETYTQKQVDKTLRAAAIAANKERNQLATIAHSNPGKGEVNEKIV